jgi:DNA-directed RNA polymerase sigma subunit (sigma70/sigma32)
MHAKRKHKLRHGQLCSQQDIADAWGVSRVRIDQIERRAFAKLRAAIAELAERDGVSVREWLLGEPN